LTTITPSCFGRKEAKSIAAGEIGQRPISLVQ